MFVPHPDASDTAGHTLVRDQAGGPPTRRRIRPAYTQQGTGPLDPMPLSAVPGTYSGGAIRSARRP
jgi:hypothetical protein